MMNWKFLFNPFFKPSEKTLLAAGILATLLGSLAGGWLNMVYDGFMDVHSSESSFLQSLQENLINIFSVSLLLFILGYFINRKTRIIDIVNTAMIARIPTYLSAILAANPVLDRFAERIMENPGDLNSIYSDSTELTVVLVISFALMLLMVWSIVLLVNGFAVATNIRKPVHWILFAVALILAEVLSKFLIYTFYS